MFNSCLSASFIFQLTLFREHNAFYKDARLCVATASPSREKTIVLLVPQALTFIEMRITIRALPGERMAGGSAACSILRWLINLGMHLQVELGIKRQGLGDLSSLGDAHSCVFTGL